MDINFSDWWESQYPNKWVSPTIESGVRSIAHESWLASRSQTKEPSADSAVALLKEWLEGLAENKENLIKRTIKFFDQPSQQSADKPEGEPYCQNSSKLHRGMKDSGLVNCSYCRIEL